MFGSCYCCFGLKVVIFFVFWKLLLSLWFGSCYCLSGLEVAIVFVVWKL